MKKVFIIIDHFKFGGAERVASIIANAMCDECEVHALVVDPAQNYPVDKRVIIHILKNSKFHILRIFNRIFEYIQLSREIRPDVIFAFGNYVSMYACVCKKILRDSTTFIASERTDPTREPHSRMAVYLRNYAYKNADYLVCQTQWVKQYFEHLNISKRCVVIPNPISPNLPNWKGEDSNIIMTACRLESQKNIPLLIEAFALFHKKNPKYILKIFGEGSLKKLLQKMVKEYDLEESIVFSGFSKEIMFEMTKAKMYVSTSNYEGISNSMLEAIGIGVPIVHTDCPVGGAAMYVKDDENGFLVPVGDKDAIVAAMQKIVDCNLNSHTLNISAQTLQKNLSSERIANLWTNLAE